MYRTVVAPGRPRAKRLVMAALCCALIPVCILATPVPDARRSADDRVSSAEVDSATRLRPPSQPVEHNFPSRRALSQARLPSAVLDCALVSTAPPVFVDGGSSTTTTGRCEARSVKVSPRTVLLRYSWYRKLGLIHAYCIPTIVVYIAIDRCQWQWCKKIRASSLP